MRRDLRWLGLLVLGLTVMLGCGDDDGGDGDAGSGGMDGSMAGVGGSMAGAAGSMAGAGGSKPGYCDPEFDAVTTCTESV
jgi:hypothetical protein